ncbi:PIR Superfamily Protein [Plasmodium ovale curtisi]|uniref:PIR Superfamily Protein n=2 Tax=Plasmodium ovale curtisi TaxID=864141 RepID=A0A1A8X788_PLAOA|nr:PIR Superfamily Protein [Plasmodium ovale curtisi]
MTGKKLTELQNYEFFHKERSQFHYSDNSAYTDVLKTNDPVLRSLSLYLIQYYNDVSTRCSLNDDCTLTCEIMNKWLNEKEAIYTSNGKRALNSKLWNTYIEELWNILGKSSAKQNWCKRDRPKYGNNEYPDDWIHENCNNTKSIDVSLNCANNPYYKSQEVRPLGDSSSSGSAITEFYGYLLFVILLSSILLYKLSPLGTWLDNKVRNKNRIRESINAEVMDEFSRTLPYNSSPLSSKFNVVHHS